MASLYRRRSAGLARHRAAPHIGGMISADPQIPPTRGGAAGFDIPPAGD